MSNFAGLVGRQIFNTFLVISWELVHIFQNQFLYWRVGRGKASRCPRGFNYWKGKTESANQDSTFCFFEPSKIHTRLFVLESNPIDLLSVVVANSVWIV